MSDKELSEYVTLISNDGFEFIIKRDAANVAGTIRKMLDPTSRSPPLFPPTHIQAPYSFIPSYAVLRVILTNVRAGNFAEASSGRCESTEFKSAALLLSQSHTSYLWRHIGSINVLTRLLAAPL